MVHLILLFWGGKQMRMSKRYQNIDLEEMMEARVHLGHKTRKWNPKMTSYIFIECKDTHIINLAKTTLSLSKSCDLAFDIVSRGKQFLIVGTKYQATNLVASTATEA
jgi:small subunit ribosomal protein S2